MSGLTFVVVASNQQQFERTLRSCGASYQSAPSDELEIVIIDDRSSPVTLESVIEAHPEVSKILLTGDYSNPVLAFNEGMRQAKFGSVALLPDGAQLLSPGIFRRTSELVELFARPVISVPQYMLGSNAHEWSAVDHAFERESADLERLGWPDRGYPIFNAATRATEPTTLPHLADFEGGCLIATKATLEEFEFLDGEKVDSNLPVAILELFRRLVDEPRNHYVRLPGEGTFRQDVDHGRPRRSPEALRNALADFGRMDESANPDQAMHVLRSPFHFGPVTNAAARVPTISKQYGAEKTRLLDELSQFHRASMAIGETPPHLHLSGKPPVEEHAPRPRLVPLEGIDATAALQNCDIEELNYLSVLARVHAELRPNLYLEIGVDNGDSLQLARCVSIGIDPAFEVNCTQPFPTSLFRSTSDDFFDNQQLCENRLSCGIDLAYIDGMHLAEFVVRDFINVEKWANPEGVIVLDDVLPEQIEMADRERRFNAWCGDIYKLLPILSLYRPDLNVRTVEAYAGPYRKGLAIITNLDPTSSVLDDNFDEVASRIAESYFDKLTIAAIEENASLVSVTDLFAEGFGRSS